MVQSSERRRGERFPTLLSCQLHITRDDTTIAAEPAAVVSDISRCGCFVATSSRAAVGQTVVVEFTAPHGLCLAVGNVIANRDDRGFAIEFQGETPKMKSFFDVVEKLPYTDRWTLLQHIDRARVEQV